MVTISVIVPTITGREDWLGACLDSYAMTTEDYEVIVVPNRVTCGQAWNDGAERATGEYLHFSADDLVAHEGWADVAIECVDGGALPCARVLNPDGSLQSCGEWSSEMPDGTQTNIARVPFLSRDQWERVGPSLETHYYTDTYLAARARAAGIPVVVCRDMVFTHHHAPEGRYGNDKLNADHETYARALV